MRSLTWSLVISLLVRDARTSALKVDTSNYLRMAGRRSPLALGMATKVQEELPSSAKRFAVRPDKILDVLGSVPQILLRLGSGVQVDGYHVNISKEEEGDENVYTFARAFGYKVTERGNTWERKQPRKPIEIYEFEGSPFCRKVREAINFLDLDVIFYPCPKEGPTFRPKADKIGGKQQFPFMVDPNTKVSMYESDDIIQYLFNSYGEGAKVPFQLKLGFMTAVTAVLGQLPRGMKGVRYVPAKMPKKPLELWGYEASPYTKPVREKLCELEIPHKFVASARGSPKRQKLFEMAGAGQTPYLIDPNTGAKGFESAEIMDYLDKVYAL